MTRVIMVRHGESRANKEGKFAGGYSDVPLLERGLRQAELMAEYAAEHYDIANVYTSRLQRAYITGKCVADKFGLEVKILDDLREIDGGCWEGCPFEEMGPRYPEEYRAWMTDRGNARCPGGESVAEMTERVLAALAQIAGENPGKTVLLVSHATPIHAIYALAVNGSLDNMNSLPLAPNAALTIVDYENGKLRCEACGIDSYLGELKTELPKNV